MTPQTAAAWDRNPADHQTSPRSRITEVHYGPDIATESELRLCGDVKGKRVLELGCGRAHSSIAFAKQGAIVIGVEVSAEELAAARRLCEREEVGVDLHRSDLADLAYIRADSIDLVFSAYALSHVADLNRVFRQVHRVLRPSSHLVFSLPHPAYDMIDDRSGEPLLIRRSYFDRSPMQYQWNGNIVTDYRRTIGDLVTSLNRSNFRVDTIIEPEPIMSGPHSRWWKEAFLMVPRTLIIRARKEGI